MPQFIVTFTRDIKANEPIMVEAKGILWALCSLGATVWTEEEWREAQERLQRTPDSTL